MAASNTTNTLKDGTKKRIRYYSCSNFRNKGSKVCSANSVRADVIEKYVMDQILEIVKSDKVINQVLERVNQENKVDIGALNHDIAYKQQQYDEVSGKLHNLVKTIEERIFQNIESMDKAQLKALYLTVIDRIDIRKDGNHKKQFYVTLKLNNEIIKQLFNNTPLDEVLLSTSSLFLPQTLFLQI